MSENSSHIVLIFFSLFINEVKFIYSIYIAYSYSFSVFITKLNSLILKDYTVVLHMCILSNTNLLSRIFMFLPGTYA